jgi:hypothetical protein
MGTPRRNSYNKPRTTTCELPAEIADSVPGGQALQESLAHAVSSVARLFDFGGLFPARRRSLIQTPMPPAHNPMTQEWSRFVADLDEMVSRATSGTSATTAQEKSQSSGTPRHNV